MHVKLADIADIRTGYSFRNKINDDPNGGLAVIQLKDIRDDGRLDVRDCIHIQEEPVHDRHRLHAGDVLMQARGTRFPAALLDSPISAVASFGLHVLRPSTDKLEPGYLAWVLNQPALATAIHAVAKGSAVAFVSKTNLASIPIPLPPLRTQRQLVHIADLQRESVHLTAELQRLHNQYAAAITWRAANQD